MLNPDAAVEIGPEVLAGISDPAFVLNASGEVMVLNPSALGFCGGSRADVLGTPCSELVRVHGDPRGRTLERLFEQARYQIGASEMAPVRCEVVLRMAQAPLICELVIYPLARLGELPRQFVLLVRQAGAEPLGFSMQASRWHTDALRRVKAVLHEHRNPERFLGVVRAVFDAERAWLIHPCAPRAATCALLAEDTEPEFPGAMARRVPVPVESRTQRVLNQSLMQKTPLVFERMKGVLPDEVVKQFGIRSQMLVRIRPRTGRPWLLGLHQCTAPRAWAPEEQNLLAGIARHLTQAIDSHLLQRTLTPQAG